MKLIDILVQELPKRGGWPCETACITQDEDGSLCLWKDNKVESVDNYWCHPTGCGLVEYCCGDQAVAKSDDHRTAIVTREQYEAVLKQSVWDGTGAPPVGVECERSWCGDKWLRCTVLFVSDEMVVVKLATREACYRRNEVKFRPIRTERDEDIDEMHRIYLNLPDSASIREFCKKLYDAGYRKLSD